VARPCAGGGRALRFGDNEYPRGGLRTRRLSELRDARRICDQRSGRASPRSDDAPLSHLREASTAGSRGRVGDRRDNDLVPAAIRCKECHREVDEFKRWGYWSDGCGALLEFCPRSALGVSSLRKRSWQPLLPSINGKRSDRPPPDRAVGS